MRTSIYTGTEIIFDLNEANSQGGAVFATTESEFICDSCNFTNNKAVKGGGIYVEAASRSEISLSTFSRNEATENGSAYYMASSKTQPMSSILISTFTNNVVEKIASIFLMEASLILDDIALDNNLTNG